MAVAPDRQRKLAAYYDGLAEVYGDGAVFAARRKAILAAIEPELAAAASVLDLGCGNASYTAALADSRFAVGVDISTEMLAAAMHRLHGRAQLVRADALALPFCTGTFDVVFMSHVLQLIDDIEDCVGQIARVLAPAGTWISTLGSGGWRKTILELLGNDALQELARLINPRRSAAPNDDKQRVVSICERLGLAVDMRRAPFSVNWSALEEWIRIRWLTLADTATRERAERWLESIRSNAAALSFEINETVLVARRLS